MRYIASIACKEKLLLTLKQCKILKAPKRLRELSIKSVYDMFKTDFELNKYLPILKKNRLPPREHYFIVLTSIRPQKYAELLATVDKKDYKRKRITNIVYLFLKIS